MSDGKKLKPQHAPKSPHEDPQFLKSTPARPIRILGEYIHPLVQLKREGIGDTIPREPRDERRERAARRDAGAEHDARRPDARRKCQQRGRE